MKKEKETKKAVSAKETTKKANVSAKEILAKFATDTSGLLQTSLSTKKSSIYKEELFSSCNEKEKKSLRKKLRNTIFAAAKGIVAESNKEKQQKLVNAFVDFYKATYKVNDFSLASVCNENLASEKKDILQKALSICKK